MKTMEILIAIAAALLLVACAVPGAGLSKAVPAPAEPLRGDVRAPMLIAAATLTSTGTCEYDTSPAFTSVILSRRVAAHRLVAGTLTVEQARAVQALADSARAEIERACPQPTAAVKPDAERMRRADALLAQIRTTLEAR